MDAPPISNFVLGFFRHIAQGYFRRHFRAVRIHGAERVTAAARRGGPLIIYANHGSWWDPMVQVLLAARLMEDRRHYAPMDADSLKRYGILKRIGVFGVEMKTVRGAAIFLRTGLKILGGNGVLWVTPQGRFADARERPVEFKPGLAALAARVQGGCTLIPLAIEYVFWDERLPEVLLRFGEEIRVEGDSAETIEPRLRHGLECVMDRLRDLAIARDPAAFSLLSQGRSGSGGFYELGHRILARLRGRKYQAEHTPPPQAQG